MKNKSKVIPTLSNFIVFILILVIVSWLLSGGENSFAEASYIFSFLFFITVFDYFFEPKKCIYEIFFILLSGSIGGIVYWYVVSSEVELFKSITYGALIGLIWIIIDSFSAKEKGTCI